MTAHPGAVALLNASSEPLGTIDFPRAVRMMFRRVVEVLEADENRSIGPYPWPKVLRLIRTVADTFLDRPARWHRGGVFIRDGHRCAYCGGRADTIDHILPQSRGGRWEWFNCGQRLPHLQQRVEAQPHPGRGRDAVGVRPPVRAHGAAVAGPGARMKVPGWLS